MAKKFKRRPKSRTRQPRKMSKLEQRYADAAIGLVPAVLSAQKATLRMTNRLSQMITRLESVRNFIQALQDDAQRRAQEKDAEIRKSDVPE